VDSHIECMGPAAGCESAKRDVEERDAVYERAPVMCEFHKH
jgi:hypothetical protein